VAPLHKFLDGIPCGEQDQHSQSQSQSQSHSLSRRSDDGDTQRGHIGDEDDEHDDDERDNVENDENAQDDIDIHGSAVGNNDLGAGNGKTSFENDHEGLRHDDDKRNTTPKQNHCQDASSIIAPLFQQPKTPLNVQDETDIDRILEMASDNLSLGQNELALQAYRRAMKCAFADVISVKRQLMEVKKLQKRQQKQQQRQRDDVRGIDPSPVNSPSSTSTSDMELTKQQEQRFELTLLQVASRVADIHNNMGVVHEMNRSFQKAQASYQDALDVYHNTCRRFEEEGDSDVERTNRNVARMISACRSEQERKSLHDRAAKIAKRVEYEKHFATRKNLLNDAVATLQMALELEGDALGHSHPLAASTLIQMGKYHYEMREFDSAVMEIHKAVQILRNALGGNHPQVGRALLLLASVYERQGPKITPHGTSKDDVELELYVDALEPLKATLGNVHDDVGFLYVKIGYLYGKKGDRNMALLAYKAIWRAFLLPIARRCSSRGGFGMGSSHRASGRDQIHVGSSGGRSTGSVFVTIDKRFIISRCETQQPFRRCQRWICIYHRCTNFQKVSYPNQLHDVLSIPLHDVAMSWPSTYSPRSIPIGKRSMSRIPPNGLGDRIGHPRHRTPLQSSITFCYETQESSSH